METMKLSPVIFSVMLLAALHSPVQAFELLSAEQLAAEQQALIAAKNEPALAPARSRSIKLAPNIKVVSPPLDGGALKSPLRIELRFEPLGEVKINPASFKVLYGMLLIDLTDKIRSNATLSEAGLLAEQASIPSGSHRLLLQVADMAGRVTETELRFKVD
jgi:hypothetical protein